MRLADVLETERAIRAEKRDRAARVRHGLDVTNNDRALAELEIKLRVARESGPVRW